MVIYEDGILTIHRLLLNEIKTNCFIIQRGSEALLVDPTDNPDLIIEYLANRNLELKFMITTHGHFDHVAAAAGIIERGLTSMLFLHEKDFEEIKRGPLYSSIVFKRNMRVAKVAMFSEEVLSFLGSWGLCIEHAGGHTKGSCFLYDTGRNFIITGDLVLHHKLNITLFNSRENISELTFFIEKVKKTFKPETVILPGHGERSTLALELANNKKWAYIQKKEFEAKS